MRDDEFEPYVRDLGRLLSLPEERAKALAVAENTGQSALDRAKSDQRRSRDAEVAVTRRLSSVEDRLRRLQARTGPVEALEPEAVPTQLQALSGFLDGMLRDLESIENAQAWVERARAQPAPIGGSDSASPAITRGVPALDGRSDNHTVSVVPKRSPWLIGLAIAVLVILIAIAAILVTR